MSHQLLLAMIVEMELMEVSWKRSREIDFFPPFLQYVIGREFMICLMALNSTEDITFSSLGFSARIDKPLCRKESTQGPYPSFELIQATMDYKCAPF